MWSKRKSKGALVERTENQVATMIATNINLLQGKTVAGLQFIERKLSIRQKKLLLLAFCLFAGFYCANLLVQAIKGKGSGAELTTLTSPHQPDIPLPKH